VHSHTNDARCENASCGHQALRLSYAVEQHLHSTRFKRPATLRGEHELASVRRDLCVVRQSLVALSAGVKRMTEKFLVLHATCGCAWCASYWDEFMSMCFGNWFGQTMRVEWVP
jgi:hypothetical protein